MKTAHRDTTGPALGVIILGASEFPHFPSSRGLNNPSFARSAGAFYNLVIDPNTSLFGVPAILDLFDTPDDPALMVRGIKRFLGEIRNLTDVIIYYCGHGDFLPDAHKTYVLTIKATEPDNEAFTALPLSQMRAALDRQLAMKRVFLVLDCCFAGRAATEWQADGIGHVIENQVFEVFPRRGTALIAASAKGEPALAPDAQRLTMFTGAFVQTVREGLAGQQKELSFRDVFQGTRTRIIESYGAAAAVPVIHAPYQPDGDISFDPFFVNKAFAPPPEPDPTAAEKELFELATNDLKSPLAVTRAAALDAFVMLLADAKSSALRSEVLIRVEHLRDNDDSNTVRLKCRDILTKNAKIKSTSVPEDAFAKALADAITESPLSDTSRSATTLGRRRTAISPEGDLLDPSRRTLPPAQLEMAVRRSNKTIWTAKGTRRTQSLSPARKSPRELSTSRERGYWSNVKYIAIVFCFLDIIFLAFWIPAFGYSIVPLVISQIVLAIMSIIAAAVNYLFRSILRTLRVNETFPIALRLVPAVVLPLTTLWLAYLLLS